MLAGAFSCRHLNAHGSDEYIVPEASDGDVTDAACPGRILLVEQQVSLPLFLIKTETDIQATFTSHQDNSPKVHLSSNRSVTHEIPCLDLFLQPIRDSGHPPLTPYVDLDITRYRAAYVPVRRSN